MLGNGTGKTRGNSNITLKPTLTFRGHCFFTANITAEQHIRNSGQSETGGHMVRILDIPAAFGKFGVFENLHEFPSGDAFSKKLQEETTKKHGSLGREFIKCLTNPENRILITQLYEEIRVLMLKGLPKENNGQVGRTVNNFAKNAAAFEAAIQFNLLGSHFKKEDGIAANVALLNVWISNRGGIGNHESRNIINDAKGFISKHGASRFQLEGKGSNGLPEERSSIPNRLGFKEWFNDSWVYYLSNDGFKELCGDQNPNQVKDVLAEANIIEKKLAKKNGKPYFEFTQSHKFGGEKKSRYVVFTGGTDLDNEVDC
jgi:putative DNA primase/helicase